ncbi:MAG: hypothetical protein B6D41_03570 [Chloroflexi bacterium UTCFX4]|jgi:formylglycine-generating enzyme required for sulfatase activity|nr:MAG: hypothetical protein B6D41_03570 [Chloroflexi bacterium UTCFX4]
MEYLDFYLTIGSRVGESQFAVAARSQTAGEASGIFIPPLTEDQLENFVLKIGLTRRGVRRIGSSEWRAAQEFGRKLFQAAFSEQVRDCLIASRNDAHRQGKGLRVKVVLQAPELGDYPWEFLYDPGNGQFLSLFEETPVVRYVDLPRPIQPLTVAPPLRILAVASSPRDYEALDITRERRNLEQALADLLPTGQIELEWLPAANLDALRAQLLKQEYHIFHFIGHGGFDEAKQDGALVFEDENQLGRAVSGERLAIILGNHRTVRLAVLNACEGARTSRQDPFAGAAMTLVRTGNIPAVAAMQFEITDTAAIDFARGFYSAISAGRPVDAAVGQGRQAIFARDNDVEWGTPVLYLRAVDGHIFRIDKELARKRAEAEQAAALAAAEQLARERAEQERLANERAEQERAAREKEEQARRAREEEDARRIAAAKAEQERLEREKAEQERAAREKEEQARRTREEEDARRIAVAKAEQERLEREKAEQEQRARERAEQERRANEQAEKERIARARTAQAARTAAPPAMPERAQRKPATMADAPAERLYGGLSARYALPIAAVIGFALLLCGGGAYVLGVFNRGTPTPTSAALVDPTAVSTRATATNAPPTIRRETVLVVVTAPLPTRVSPTLELTQIPVPTVPPATSPPQAGTLQNRGTDDAPMVFVPAGEFLMGSTDQQVADALKLCSTCNFDDEKPQHTVYLDAFWIDQHEVTNALYKKCVDAGKCQPPNPTVSYTRDPYYGNAQYDNYPVVYVSWDYANSYCEWVGKRLPTEAEWEKAARGSDGRIYPWGNTFDKNLLNSSEGGAGDTTEVGKYPNGASPYRALDMAGNVWEWVHDWHDANFYSSPPRENPQGPSTGQYRVLRGGSFGRNRDIVRAAVRGGVAPDSRNSNIGFRCAQ